MPFRSSLPGSVAALVLVVPVLAGVVTGGLGGGLVSVAVGFAAYDLFFIPPYGTLSVGRSSNWVALGVYAAAMGLVARLVSGLEQARAMSLAREVSARHLLELSEVLLVDKPVPDLGADVVAWAGLALGAKATALVLAEDGRLEVVASGGAPISEAEMARLQPGAGAPVPLSTGGSEAPLQTLALVSSGRPVGLLVLRSLPPGPALKETLPILANHLATALERAQLRERALQADLLEQAETLRRSLIGAVSHDLRNPLATIKVASSTLLEKGGDLPGQDAQELYELVDAEADRLTRLVGSLLDMTRIQAGALEVRRQPQALTDLAEEAVSQLRSSLGGRQVRALVPADLPLVTADPVLIVQVLANLVDNANRFGPPGTPLEISASLDGPSRVVVSVSDRGPGVPRQERETIFERFVRYDTGGRSGLGLAIAKAFVEAHGGQIWVEEAPGGGARFAFTLSVDAVHVPVA